MPKRIPIVNIDALFGDTHAEPNPAADPRPMLYAAKVILAVDHMTGREILVYGRKALGKIIAGGKPKKLPVLLIGLDAESDDREKLLALLTVVKGRHDYGPDEEPQGRAGGRPRR